jgi:hypothetical protein
MRFNRLTIPGDHPDVYDVPDSPPDKRARNEQWRPGSWSQNMDTGNTIHVSTPNRRAETTYWEEPVLPPKQYTTPREKTTMITHIHEALKTKPNEGLTVDDILDWFRTNQSTMYQARGKVSLRKTIQTNLNRKPSGKKCTVSRCTDGTWRLRPDEAVVAELTGKEGTQTHAERQTHTPFVSVLSTGGRTSDGTPALCEDIPRSELLQTGDRDHENGQAVQPTAFSQAESEYGPTSIDSQPKAPAREAGANAGNETPQPRAATRSAWTSDEQSPNHDETPTQQSEPSAEISSMIHNDNPSGIEECRVPVDLCYGPKRAKSINTPTPAKRLKKVQDDLKPLVKEHIPFQAPGITTEGIYQHVMANSVQATEWSNRETVRVHIRTILKHMYDSGDALREMAKGNNGGSTFVYTLSPSFGTEPSPPVYTPPMGSSLTTWTHAHQDTAHSVSGHPAKLDHLLRRPEEGLPSATQVLAPASHWVTRKVRKMSIRQVRRTSPLLSLSLRSVLAIGQALSSHKHGMGPSLEGRILTKLTRSSWRRQGASEPKWNLPRTTYQCQSSKCSRFKANVSRLSARRVKKDRRESSFAHMHSACEKNSRRQRAKQRNFKKVQIGLKKKPTMNGTHARNMKQSSPLQKKGPRRSRKSGRRLEMS